MNPRKTVVAGLLLGALAGCGGSATTATSVPAATVAPTPAGVDQSDPAKVVQAMFDAASTKNFAPLGNLCDPTGQGDGDVKEVCALATSTDTEQQNEFAEMLGTGKIEGAPRLSADGNEAEVDFTFGPGGREKETMKLVKRDGKWYYSGM